MLGIKEIQISPRSSLLRKTEEQTNAVKCDESWLSGCTKKEGIKLGHLEMQGIASEWRRLIFGKQ